MKKLNLLPLLLLLATSVQCGLLDEEVLDIPITQDITFTVPINAGSLTGGQTGSAPQDVSYPFEFGQSFDLISMNSEIAKYQSNITEVRVDSIVYSAGNTSMTTDIQPVVLYSAPNGVGSPSDSQANRFATTSTISAGSSFSNRSASIDANGQSQASAHFASLRCAVLVSTELAVQQGQPIPTGQVELTFTITVTLVANPV